MMFGWIIIIVLVILAVWYFSQNSERWQGRRTTKEDSPLETLKKRLASGEISREEYKEQKKLLEEK